MKRPQPIILRLTGVEYVHSHDEDAFFFWLEKMGCVSQVYGEGRDLVVELRRLPDEHDLRELLAFYFRYQIDMTALVQFEHSSNTAWLRDPKMFWADRLPV